MSKRNQTPPKSFEDAFNELQAIVEKIERGDIALEESLQKYERGNYLIQHCLGILGSAEKQIEQISRSQDGALKTAPLAETQEQT